MTALMPTPILRFDPAGLEVSPSAERFAAFAEMVDALTLANLTDRLGETYGSRTAFILEEPLVLPGAEGTVLSFAALADLVRRATAALVALGIGRGDRVALCTRNRMELAVAEWAVLRAGAVAVPLGSRLPREELVRMIADAGARVLVADRQVLGGVLRDAALPVAARVVVDGDDADGALGFGRLLARAADGSAPAEVADDDLALIFYTSGTTGRAKGVMLTHGNVMFATRATLRMTAAMGPPFRMLGLMVMPLANTSGHQGLLLSIARGTSTAVLDRFDPHAVLDLIEAHRVNLLSGTPTMFRLLWDAGAPSRDLSSIISFGGGGDYFDLDLVRRFQALPRGADTPAFFVTGYGMTETAGQVTQAFPAIETDGDLGVVQPGIDYRIVDPEGRPVPPGEVGELEVRGPNVTRGYWQAPEATAAAFRDGWLRTGDLVREGSEPRRLVFAGRAKDVIISGGNTIYPPEIERVLLEHPSVARAAVVGLPDPLMGQAVAAAVEPRAGVTLDEGELLAWLRDRLAPYQRPRAVHLMTLPTSADLKVKRRLVGELIARGSVG
jgi:acyl-CoA synthetase (AMP-forming)/AMP-acid ligase II